MIAITEMDCVNFVLHFKDNHCYDYEMVQQLAAQFIPASLRFNCNRTKGYLIPPLERHEVFGASSRQLNHRAHLSRCFCRNVPFCKHHRNNLEWSHQLGVDCLSYCLPRGLRCSLWFPNI